MAEMTTPGMSIVNGDDGLYRARTLSVWFDMHLHKQCVCVAHPTASDDFSSN